jgi:hypothetical protein
MRNAYNTLIEKHEWKNHLGGTGIDGKINQNGSWGIGWEGTG